MSLYETLDLRCIFKSWFWERLESLLSVPSPRVGEGVSIFFFLNSQRHGVIFHPLVHFSDAHSSYSCSGSVSQILPWKWVRSRALTIPCCLQRCSLALAGRRSRARV